MKNIFLSGVTIVSILCSTSGYTQTVKIGSQVWMKENLNVDKFRNGDPIPEAKTYAEWEAAAKRKQPAWCYYDNDPRNGAKYGKLYNWYAVSDSRGLAPEGWHLPSVEEWKTSGYFLGGEDVAGTKMKSTSEWADVNGVIDGTNVSGFSALPGGFRDNHGFRDVLKFGAWWSSSELHTTSTSAWYRSLTHYSTYAASQLSYKSNGFSVRCLKD